MPRKQRAMIRKGMRNGLTSEIDRSVDRFFALYADNVHRHGTPPFAKSYFARLTEVFGDCCEISIVTDAGGRPLSGVLSFYFRDEVLPYYAGDTVDARELAANDFKYWELMRRACERGVRVFDYGRSKRGTGSFDFKKNWGFEPEPLALRVSVAQAHHDPAEQPAQSEVPDAGRNVAAAAASAGERARADADPQSGVDMADAAQWVRGLVGRRHDATVAGPQGSRVGARVAPADPTPDAGRDDRAIETSGWRATWRLAPVLAAGAAVVGILALYWPTAASIVAIWIRSETFTHGFVVVPICFWLVWRHRETIAAIPARPWWPGVAMVLAAGALWFVTSAADVLGVKQFALAFMLQAAIVTVLGTRIARAAFFPLAFLLFAVPFGEIFVPTLIDWTADFTIAALRWSGVPVYREANLFVIPSGAWSVVEACSGIRYIIASVMIGTIYAAVAYRSTLRRVMFMAAAILVPIVANWLRAYMIVMIGHLSNNKLAVGVDHIIYGWVFFGLVMLLLFWVGSFWQEDAAPITAPPPQPATGTAPVASPRVLFAAVVAAIVAAGLWVPLEASIDRSARAGKPAIPAIADANGWAPAAAGAADWKPHYRGYAAELRQTFSKDDRDVGLYLAYYRQPVQRERADHLGQSAGRAGGLEVEASRKGRATASNGAGGPSASNGRICPGKRRRWKSIACTGSTGT